MSARPRAIPPKLESDVLAKAGEGWSTRKISAWLLQEHKVRASNVSVANLLKDTREERAVISKAVVRERLSAEVVSDIDVLSREQGRIEEIGKRVHALALSALDKIAAALDGREIDANALKAANAVADWAVDAALKATDRVDKLANRKLHYSGAGGSDDVDAEAAEAGDRIRSRLGRIAEPEGEGSSAPVDSADPS